MNFCYSCVITPTGLPPIVPFTQLITVVADPLDCSSSFVVNTEFVDTITILYNYFGTSKTLVKSYKEIFIHT